MISFSIAALSSHPSHPLRYFSMENNSTETSDIICWTDFIKLPHLYYMNGINLQMNPKHGEGVANGLIEVFLDVCHFGIQKPFRDIWCDDVSISHMIYVVCIKMFFHIIFCSFWGGLRINRLNILN